MGLLDRVLPLQQRDGYRLWDGGPVPKGYVGITLGDVIIVKRGLGDDEALLAHERVHVDQWRRLGLWRFARIYLGSYLRSRLAGYDHATSYHRIPLEVDACWNAACGSTTTSLVTPAEQRAAGSSSRSGSGPGRSRWKRLWRSLKRNRR